MQKKMAKVTSWLQTKKKGQNHIAVLRSPCLACFTAVWKKDLITLITFLMKYAWIILFHYDLKWVGGGGSDSIRLSFTRQGWKRVGCIA